MFIKRVVRVLLEWNFGILKIILVNQKIVIFKYIVYVLINNVCEDEREDFYFFLQVVVNIFCYFF